LFYIFLLLFIVFFCLMGPPTQTNNVFVVGRSGGPEDFTKPRKKWRVWSVSEGAEREIAFFSECKITAFFPNMQAFS